MAPGYEREAAPPVEDRLAEDLRGFGPLGILAIVVILAGNFIVAPLSGVLVLLWASRSHTPWRDLGFVRPVSWIRTAIVVAGFGEETLFRGYMFERSRRLFGSSVLANTLTALVTAMWFGSLHYREQGFAGAEQAVITGLVFGTIFAITGRIWMLMFAHTAYDLTALALIYLNLETPVAHFLFK